MDGLRFDGSYSRGNTSAGGVSVDGGPEPAPE